jgi:hypothetical protein
VTLLPFGRLSPAAESLTVTRTPDPDGADGKAIRFTRQLGLTHAEFHRSLPPAIAHRAFTVENNRIRIDVGERTVTMELGPQRYRAIASLRLPYVEVTFTFIGFSGGERHAFMERFERYFQRGGG